MNLLQSNHFNTPIVFLERLIIFVEASMFNVLDKQTKTNLSDDELKGKSTLSGLTFKKISCFIIWICSFSLCSLWGE